MEKMRPLYFEPFHTTCCRVPLYEVDVGGGVYHGNYFHFFEIGRDDFFRSLGYPYIGLMENRMHLTVAQLGCAYFRSLHYDDLVDVITGVKEVRSRSLVMIQRIDGSEKDGTLVPCTQAEFVLVCVGEGPKILSLPESFRRSLEKRLCHTLRFL